MVERDAALASSCASLRQWSARQMRGHIEVRFKGENGVGAGVMREWLTVLSRDLFDQVSSFFISISISISFSNLFFSNASIRFDFVEKCFVCSRRWRCSFATECSFVCQSRSFELLCVCWTCCCVGNCSRTVAWCSFHRYVYCSVLVKTRASLSGLK